MKAYEARIEATGDDCYIVELNSLNWGFYHTKADGGRGTLEPAIRSCIERLEGAKDFGVALNFTNELPHMILPEKDDYDA